MYLNMKVANNFVCFLLICIILKVRCWRIFNKGRLVGGNLRFSAEGDELLTLNNNIGEVWFTQLLDHFNPTDTTTWQQRYFVNSQYFNGSANSPIFIMIGGEGEASLKWMVNGTWIDYAKRFGALCFQVEHRYYGKSRPTKNLSTKNLRYLTSQQALADLANFIGAMNEKYSLFIENRWIAFGGSYSGSLAAWLRLKYPHLVHGAVSASGPLLAKIDFLEYIKVVDQSLNTYNDQCVSAIKEGTSEIDVLLRYVLGRINISQKFKLCDLIENSIDLNDVSNFYATLSDNFAGVVQYNKDNRGDSNKMPYNITIDTLCDIMTNQQLGPPINRLASVNNLILKAYNQTCLDYKYDKMISANTNTSWFSEVAEGGRQWTYQTCTEFGFFQTSSYRPYVFGNNFPVQFFIQQCQDIFGPKFNSLFLNQAAKRTNNIYGALDIQVTNVIFVQGSIDPWHALGITTTLEQEAPAIYIKGTAHCANMYPRSNQDPPQLNAARQQIAAHIDTWIRL